MNATDKLKQKRSDLVSAYRQVFDTEDGKLVLYDLMRSCGILKTTFVGDPYMTAFNEGQRSVCLKILKTAKEDPVKLMARIEQMQKWEESNE